MALVNVENSTIARIVDQRILLKAGPEIGVASTKAFTNQLVALLALLKKLVAKTQPELSDMISHQLGQLPSFVEHVLKSIDVKEAANLISPQSSALYLGRGAIYPVAMEGALKLKEISYIHAEGYPAGEMKHGPIALVQKNLPIVALCNSDEHLTKILSNIEEVKARDGKIILIKSKSVSLPKQLADCVIEIPDCHELIAPILQNIPLQLIALHTADLLGLDVDKPRNLAKSVTVE